MSVGFVNMFAATVDSFHVDEDAFQAVLAVYGTIAFVLWLCTFKLNKTMCALLFFVTVTFYALSAGVKSVVADKIGGW